MSTEVPCAAADSVFGVKPENIENHVKYERDWQKAMQATTFAEFDDAVTAPLHGFANKDDYYDKCSSVQFLKRIERPTLIVNSLDDPFMTPDVIPGAEMLSEHVTLEVSEAGGHVGFIEGGTPWRPRSIRRSTGWVM